MKTTINNDWNAAYPYFLIFSIQHHPCIKFWHFSNNFVSLIHVAYSITRISYFTPRHRTGKTRDLTKIPAIVSRHPRRVDPTLDPPPSQSHQNTKHYEILIAPPVKLYVGVCESGWVTVGGVPNGTPMWNYLFYAGL